VRVRVRRRGGRGSAALHRGLDERVHHGHVDVQVVRLLEALPAHRARELQLGLRLVLGHVVLQGRSLAALEPAHLAPGGEEPAVQHGRSRPPGAESDPYLLERLGP